MSSQPGPFGKPLAGGGSGLPSARLVRLHRHSLTNVLVVGGTAERRAQVARAFHQESPLRAGPFIHVDCSLDESRLRAALEDWTAAPTELIGTPTNPFRDAEHGTLYLDPVEQLAPDTQRLLLALARRLHGAPGADNNSPCAGRLVSGNPRGLGEAVSEGRFMAALYDALDKVRVELEAVTPERPA